MPELPEVETLVRQLRAVIIGKKIKSVEVLRAKSYQGDTRDLIGKTISSIDRIGKLMIFNLDREFPKLLIHLKMTGQLIYENSKSEVRNPKQKNSKLKNQNKKINSRIVGGHPTADWVSELPSKHTRVIITFTDKSILYFNDQRVFGWLKIVIRERDLEKEKEGYKGLDPLLLTFDGNLIKATIGKMKKPIKTAILEQHKIAGLGNIYANDALYLAGIHPMTLSNSLNLMQWQMLAKSIQKVLLRGIELGGASQTNYVHIDGMGGSYQNEFLVYKQEKKECGICGSVIIKIKLGGRGTFFCPKCQGEKN